MTGLILFDCDGTLVDSQHHIVATMTSAFAACDLPPPPAAAIRSTVGLSLVEAAAELLPGTERRQHEAVADAYRRAYHAARTHDEADEPLFPGIAEALVALNRAGYLLGVATGKGRRGLEGVLARHGLRELFVTLQTADRSPSKPAPDMVYNALAETGSTAAETIVIGDTTYDMAMARNAGVAAIGVSWGYHPAPALLAAGAAAMIDDIADLPGALAGLLIRSES